MRGPAGGARTSSRSTKTDKCDNQDAIHLDLDPDGEIENSEKSIFKIGNQNFCYIQVIVFDCQKYKKCFSQFFHGSGLAKCQSLTLVDS